MFPLFWLCPRCCRVDFECKHTQHSRTFSFSRVLRGSCPMDNPMRSNSLWGKMAKVFGQIKLLGDDLGIFWYTPQISVHKKNVSNFDLLTYPHLSPSFPHGEAVLSACAVPAWCLALDLAEADGAVDVLSFNAAAWRSWMRLEWPGWSQLGIAGCYGNLWHYGTKMNKTDETEFPQWLHLCTGDDSTKFCKIHQIKTHIWFII